MLIPGGTVLTVSSRALVDACENLGVDVDLLVHGVGLDRNVINDPDARIPTIKVGELWQHAYALAGDPNLALHAVEALPFWLTLRSISSTPCLPEHLYHFASDENVYTVSPRYF